MYPIEILVNDLARHESPSSSVVRVPDRSMEGHEFDSCQGPGFFL